MLDLQTLPRCRLHVRCARVQSFCRAAGSEGLLEFSASAVPGHTEYVHLTTTQRKDRSCHRPAHVPTPAS